MQRRCLKILAVISCLFAMCGPAHANDKNLLFPDTLKIPLIGPAKKTDVCMSPSVREAFKKDIGITFNQISFTCARLSAKAVEQYDDENNIFLLLAYANVLHDRGWKTIDMVDGTPLIKSPMTENGCTQHIMLSGGALSFYFPEGSFTDDEGQYLFILFNLNADGEPCETNSNK